MTQEQRQKHSEFMKAQWKKRGFRRKIKEARKERRRQGKNLVNIPQLESNQDYRDYQKLQHRSWYKRNRDKWNTYALKKKYEQTTTDRLIALRTKWVNQVENFNNKKYQRNIDLIDTVLSERISEDSKIIPNTTPHFLQEAWWHLGELKEILKIVTEFSDPDAWRAELNEEVK